MQCRLMRHEIVVTPIFIMMFFTRRRQLNRVMASQWRIDAYRAHTDADSMLKCADAARKRQRVERL